MPLQPLPLEQAPAGVDPFLGLIGVPPPGGEAGYREWREMYRDRNGLLRVPDPRGDRPLSDAYGCGVVVLGFLPLPAKAT